jgi:hypothetical protein
MTSRAQLPSIAFVLAGNSLRLPAYRTSHRLRYHPYPRYAPLSVDDSLMVRSKGLLGYLANLILQSTVDFRYTDPSSAAGSSLVGSSVFKIEVEINEYIRCLLSRKM